jgi:tripartite-type tricarboxylate transporter receptor subunit TctC
MDHVARRSSDASDVGFASKWSKNSGANVLMVKKLGFAVALAMLASWALAQTYPVRPIRLISPIPPGGAPDLIARAVGHRLSMGLNQPVVVENKVGSNGQLAADYVSHAPADGYTLLVGMDSLFVINPYLYPRGNVDVNKELLPVATLGSNQFVLAIHPEVPAKTLPEFVAYVKNTKPAPAYASGGNGSQHHLTMEMFKARAGIDLLHVPYKGGTPATTATIAGEAVAMFSGTSNSALIKAGKLRAIAVSGGQRSRAMPEVPTIAEYYAGFDNTIWIGLFAPQGTPEPVVQRLRLEVTRALKSPELIEAFAKAGGIEPMLTTPEEMQQQIKRDQVKYSKLIRDLNLKLD